MRFIALAIIAVLIFDDVQSRQAVEAARAECRAMEAEPATPPAVAAQIDANTKTIADLQYKLDHQTCPAPDFSPYEKKIAERDSKIAELEKQLAEATAPKAAPKSPLDSAIAIAKAEHKNLLMILRITDCPWCDRFERDVFPGLADQASDCVVYAANWETDPAIRKRFALDENRFPRAVIYDPVRKLYRDFSASTNPQQFMSDLRGKMP